VKILLTNDDGIRAPGLAALIDEMKRLGDVVVVAPAAERSGASHSITLSDPVKVSEMQYDGVVQAYEVGGSPADCTMIALHKLLVKPPDLVVSGVNLGLNVGINVVYSGTVAAAVAGLMLGVTSIAVSLEWSENPDFSYAASVACRLGAKVARREHWHSIFNINVPALTPDEILGFKLCHQSTVSWHENYSRIDSAGEQAYMLGKRPGHEEPEEGSDLAAVRAGYVSITPLHFDLTDHDMVSRFRDVDF